MSDSLCTLKSQWYAWFCPFYKVTEKLATPEVLHRNGPSWLLLYIYCQLKCTAVMLYRVCLLTSFTALLWVLLLFQHRNYSEYFTVVIKKTILKSQTVYLTHVHGRNEHLQIYFFPVKIMQMVKHTQCRSWFWSICPYSFISKRIRTLKLPQY